MCHTPRYLIWRQLSDLYPEQIGNCEIMAKILCRCSQFKYDDVTITRADPGFEKGGGGGGSNLVPKSDTV